jgi:adenosylcobinamide-phosphate synthase
MTALFVAFIIDLWIGDPVYPWHPVRLMGKAIEWGEARLRLVLKNEYFAGGILAVGLPVLVFVGMSLIFNLCRLIHPALAWTVNMLGMYVAISIHDLRKEALGVFQDLLIGDLSQARQSVARIVGRDTGHLSDEDVARATVETVAESTVDGIVAPLFYAALGGAPLVLAYKAVNTLDSMIGHRNARYERFGYIAAKIDHAVNWIPARLSWLCITIGALFCEKNAKAAFCHGWSFCIQRDAVSDIPQAAFAGALQIQLGGENFYEGRVVGKPLLGEKIHPITPSCIQQSLNLMIVSAWLTLGGCLLLTVVCEIVRAIW